MLSKADMMGKIQEFYKENWPVPYLTFMNIYNDLLADRSAVVPEEPTDALREQFRAACMCLAVGIFDREGRGDQRLREFREKVYEHWKAKLTPEQFAPYKDIVDGAERRKAREARDLEASQPGDARSRELLKKLGLVPGGPPRKPMPVEAKQPAAAAPSAPPKPSTSPRTVDDVCRALRDEELKAEYLPREKAPELARYTLDQHEVTVKLARGAGQTYVVLSVGIGRDSVPDALERVDLFAAEMGYRRMADFAYMRKDLEFSCTVSVGPTVTNMVCAAPEGNADPATVRRIQRLHRDLGELVERMRP